MKLFLYLLVLSYTSYSQSNSLKERADAGDHSAATMVGIYYKNGENGFEKNTFKSKEYFEKANILGRDEGNFVPAYFLGLIEYESNPQKSFEIWAKMREDNERHKEKFKKQNDSSEIIKTQKKILFQISEMKKENKKLNRRIVDDLEDAYSGESQ